MRFLRVSALGACIPLLLPPLCQIASGQTVQFATNLGNINVQLLPASAPKTVANFLAYVNGGTYTNSIVHRSVPAFIWQGGGYQLQTGGIARIPANAPVVNEFGISNTRGTLAMAKLGNDPNSATNEWFFSEADNSSNLDNQDGGFTVFGKVADAASLAVMDQISNVPVFDLYNLGILTADFTAVPLTGGYSYANNPTPQNFVVVTSIAILNSQAPPVIGANGVIAASGFGGARAAAPGSFIEIYGANLASTTRGWAGTDFVNGTAPTTLDGVSATVNGQPAFINYVSPAQVNVQVPADVSPTTNAPVVVTYNGQASAAAPFAIQALAGSLYAPPNFKVSGKQYVAAYHLNGTVVSGGNIPGVATAPAAAGEILEFYGLGFGPVTQSGTPVAGQLAAGQATLATAVQFLFGPDKLPGAVSYGGFAPGFVGLDQFDVAVPAQAPSGDLALVVTQGGNNIAQTLVISIK